MAQFVREISRQVGVVIARPAVAITGAIVGGFVVSFALMWRAQGFSVRATPAGLPLSLLAHNPQLPPPRADTWGPPARRPPASVQTPPPPLKSPAQTEEVDATAPMPIGINVYNRRGRNRIEGYVANTSNKPLSVTLERVGAEGRGNSTLRVDLPPGGRRDFSSDSGLEMQTNDQIVVHSEPYQDISVQVP